MTDATKVLIGYFVGVGALLGLVAAAEHVSEAKAEAMELAQKNAASERSDEDRDIFRRREVAKNIVREIERHEEAINADQESKLRTAMAEIKPEVDEIFHFEQAAVSEEKARRKLTYTYMKNACDDILVKEKNAADSKIFFDSKISSLKVARDALAKAGQGTKKIDKQINEREAKIRADILAARSEEDKEIFDQCAEAKKALDSIDEYRKEILGKRTPEETELVAKWSNLQRELADKTSRMKKIKDQRTVAERKAFLNLSDLNSRCDDILKSESATIDKKTAYAQYLAHKGWSPLGVTIVGFLPLIPVFMVVKRYILWVLDFASKVRCPA